MSYGSSDLNGFGKNSNVCKLSGRYDFKESFDWMIFKSAPKIVMKRLMPKKVYIAVVYIIVMFFVIPGIFVALSLIDTKGATFHPYARNKLELLVLYKPNETLGDSVHNFALTKTPSGFRIPDSRSRPMK